MLVSWILEPKSYIFDYSLRFVITLSPFECEDLREWPGALIQSASHI